VTVNVQGLVDSDTLPLNVSREMLQAHDSLKTIKKKLVRKALDMIRRICDEDPNESLDKTEDTEGGWHRLDEPPLLDGFCFKKCKLET
jgi:HSP90 family molecular chaperone